MEGLREMSKLISGEEVLNNFGEIEADLLDMSGGEPMFTTTIASELVSVLEKLETDITEEQLSNIKKAMQLMSRETAASVWMEIGQSRVIRKQVLNIRKNDPEFVRFVTRLFTGNKEQ